MAWVRCTGKAIEYNSTGLTGYQNRATVIDGGYALDGNTVYVDVTVRLSTSVSSGMDIIQGFPQCTIGSGDVTAIHNNLQLRAYAYEPLLETKTSFASGATVRFVGSYTLRNI